MASPDRLPARIEAIAQRWLRDTLATYPERSATVFAQQQDPFANPVGHALRVATRAAVEILLEEKESAGSEGEGKDREAKKTAQICGCLGDVIRIRAVQEFSPSQAISFVFLLKDAIRAEWDAGDRRHPAAATELAALEAEVDRIALGAFDIYMRCRAQLYELRVNEVKRSVARLVEQRHPRAGVPPSGEEPGQPTLPECVEVERGDGR